MRLPEIRHNLRLISEACKGDLDGLAREARALEERKTYIRNEDARLRKLVEEEAERKRLVFAEDTLLTRFCSDRPSSAGALDRRRHQHTSEGYGLFIRSLS